MSSDQGAGGPVDGGPGSDASARLVLDASDAGAPDDAALLAAHVAGDPDAFGELVRRHATGSGPWPCARPVTRGRLRRPAGRVRVGYRTRRLPRRGRRHDLAAPGRRQRVPGPDAAATRPATVPLPEEDGETGHRGVADPRDDLDRLELRMEIDLALRNLPTTSARDRARRRRGLSVAEAAESSGSRRAP